MGWPMSSYRCYRNCLTAGMCELRALWPEDLVDANAWEQSDPRELALAVRALSTRLR